MHCPQCIGVYRCASSSNFRNDPQNIPPSASVLTDLILWTSQCQPPRGRIACFRHPAPHIPTSVPRQSFMQFCFLMYPYLGHPNVAEVSSQLRHSPCPFSLGYFFPFAVATLNLVDPPSTSSCRPSTLPPLEDIIPRERLGTPWRMPRMRGIGIPAAQCLLGRTSPGLCSSIQDSVSKEKDP